MNGPINYIMHIPKTAGMSLQGLARRRHKRPGELELIYSQKQVEQGFEDHDELKTVMGHFRFGYHQFSEKPHRYFTFLREPVEHVISHFHYTTDHPEKFEDLPKGINNLLDFARCPYGNNLQTRFISGMENIQGREQEAVEKAKENLVNHFGCIGLTGDFDRSLLLMGRQLKWKTLYYVRGNTGEARKNHPQPSAAEVEELKYILQYDLNLYHFAEGLYKEQLDRNPWVEKRLASFQKANALFQKLNPTYIDLKRILGGT